MKWLFFLLFPVIALAQDATNVVIPCGVDGYPPCQVNFDAGSDSVSVLNGQDSTIRSDMDVSAESNAYSLIYTTKGNVERDVKSKFDYSEAWSVWGECPAINLDLSPVIDKTVSSTAHCELLSENTGIVSTVMYFVWGFLAFRVLFSA